VKWPEEARTMLWGQCSSLETNRTITYLREEVCSLISIEWVKSVQNVEQAWLRNCSVSAQNMEQAWLRNCSVSAQNVEQAWLRNCSVTNSDTVSAR
jgi:hypothetical protein